MGHMRKPKQLELQGFIFMITKHIPLTKEERNMPFCNGQVKIYFLVFYCVPVPSVLIDDKTELRCVALDTKYHKCQHQACCNYTGWLASACAARPRACLGCHSCFMLYHLERGSQKYRDILKAIWDCKHVGREMHCAGSCKSHLSFKIFHSLYERAVRSEGRKGTWLIQQQTLARTEKHHCWLWRWLWEVIHSGTELSLV